MIIIDKLKVKGKTKNFEIYIGEFSMAKYAIYIKNKNANIFLFCDNALLNSEDEKKNSDYSLETAIAYIKSRQMEDNIIYSKNYLNRILIIEDNGIYKLEYEKLAILDSNDIFFGDQTLQPKFFWSFCNNQGLTITDTKENAIKLAREKIVFKGAVSYENIFFS